MQNEPQYRITSVDHALHLALLLQQEGPLRVSDAAARLAVSVSTAHRLLGMLVYRGFAHQRADRRYEAGDVLRPAAATPAPVALLRQVAPPYMQRLVDRVQESVNLCVRAGTETRFLATAECTQVLRVGSRAARTLPAHLTSGGRILLAALSVDELTALYDGDDRVDLPRLGRNLALVRERGFAINDQNTEAGLTAIAVEVPGSDGQPVAALAFAMPSVRFSRDRLPEWVSALRVTATEITNALA
ncbi:IclR family transcriptional regulator [Streptomyces cadmiisoli]|uniref:IclR family transcriptional regulator n=1 Tax=Streptomyces cadmiisoli TaxID=2184053 RepID=A0A2Z4J9F4_9ACTN|nr:IclR family transcriptional regulator [Streptomyces cadmiisoli]AWW41567.1 IclR family transcriptional regulator [Streptomyces cadmiisoli]